MMACSKVRPWLLWIVIAQAVFNGYWLKVPATVSVISLVSGLIVYLTFVQVSLSTRHVPLSNGKATLHFLRVAIHDNGSGIPQEILPHLYTPFVSDKKNGTGIGLSIVENLVHQQGGYLEVESGSSGTTFSVFLPYK